MTTDAASAATDGAHLAQAAGTTRAHARSPSCRKWVGVAVVLVLAAHASFSVAGADPRAAQARSIERPRAALRPNDFLFVLQWNLDDEQGIRLPLAWDLSTGAGVRVAVLDTGIVAHPDLTANIVAGYDFISDATNARDGDGRDANAIDPGDGIAIGECGPSSGARPSSFRGTALAGIIAAVTNNGQDIAGIAYDARIVPVRVLGKCGGTAADVADAIRWAAGGTVAGVAAIADPVEVIALGYTQPGACDPNMQAAIDAAVGAGVVVVAAAGNNATDAAASQPGNCANVINVAALRRIGMRAGYSNHGPAVDVAAPGGTAETFGFGIYATGFYGGQLSSPGAPEITGTPAAMAHVAGVAALMQAVKVNTPAMVEGILKRTALPPALPCPEGCGAGIIDASVAVRAAAGPLVFITPPANVIEGELGTKPFDFRVRLSQPLEVPLTFDLATANGTATAVADFVPRNAPGQVIPAGQTELVFPVAIKGEDLAEPDETFHLDIANVVGAEVLASRATARIQTDDCFPLQNGVAVTGLSGAAGLATCFQVEVPRYATGLSIVSTGAVYVRAYELPDPRGGYWLWDCYNPTCNFGVPQPATYYVMIQGREAYSGLSLKATYTPAPPPQLSIADVSVLEGNVGIQYLKFTIQLSTARHGGVSFDVATSDLDATAGSDYAAVALAGVVMPPDQASRVIRVAIPGDVDIEPNKSFRFDLANVVGATVVDGSATGTILNDDGPLLRVGDVFVKEGDAGTKLATFTVSLNKPASAPVLFDIATRDGTATAGSDYDALDLVGEAIPAGQLARTFSVTIHGDTTLEPNERIHLDLHAAPGASEIDATGYIEIQNDEGPTLSVLDTSVREGNGFRAQMRVTVRLSQVATVPVSYQFATLPGTANAADMEYPAAIYSGTIPAGSLSREHAVWIRSDEVVEPDETVLLELSNVTGASAYDWRGVGTILNDDGPALFVRNATVTEGNDGSRLATFVVSLSQPLSVPISYSIATFDGTAHAGVDFVARTLVGEAIPAGMLGRTFTVEVHGDTELEGTEVFSARLSDVGPGATAWNPVGTGYILNDDGPALSVLDASVVEGNTGTRTMNVTVRLSEPASTPVSYSIATSGGTASASSDFTPVNFADQVIPAGETSRMHAISIQGDTAQEANETILVNLGPVNGATRHDWQAIATIVNDDGPTLSVDDAVITEGNGGTKVATFTVRLSQANSIGTAYDIATSNITATAGSDYVATALAGQQIPAGQLSKTFTVTINGDVAVESNETFRVTLSNPSWGVTLFKYAGTGTITNDD